mmetsp:Transcript_9237/g.29121  ORF Transcript_9237/g.29121 Transcript_9237/m.29121 type:complete len:213 (+) Transcript_9237:698-1336(+)
MPSVKSISSLRTCPSSTEVEPSAPTRSNAVAMIRPISTELHEIVAIERRSSFPLIGVASLVTSLTILRAALPMPRCNETGEAPAATDFSPSRTIACASTVLVVVPSPALRSVLDATSTSSFTPTFCCGSESSISRAMVTPSFTISGAPYARSSTTFLPLGPSVTFTAFATMSIPSISFCRLTSSKSTVLAMRTVARCARAPDSALSAAGRGA